jgi:hypothetical protein
VERHGGQLIASSDGANGAHFEIVLLRHARSSRQRHRDEGSPLRRRHAATRAVVERIREARKQRQQHTDNVVPLADRKQNEK